MAVQWRKKVSQRTQMGKACLAHKSTVGVKSLVLVGPELISPTDEELEKGSETFPLGSYFTEYWNFGPPSVMPLQHSEAWTLKDQPSFTLQHSEAWSS